MKRVCIIGAGVSGLAACKHLLQNGLQPVVLEQSNRIGGVWRNTFASTSLQTPSFAYQFSDFPWPDGTPQYPSHHQVMGYLESYAKHFNLFERIQFDCKVVGIHRLKKDLCALGMWGENGAPSASEEGRLSGDHGAIWDVEIRRKKESVHPDGATSEWVVEKLPFDFIVLCIGRFGDVPRMPTFPLGKGPETFEGKVLHSMEYSALDDESAEKLLTGKSVVVVGLSKSALDIAAEAAKANAGKDGKPCYLVYRRAHWMVPHYQAWGVYIAFLYCTRFAELFVPKPYQGLLLRILSTIFFLPRWAVSKFVELYLIHNLPLRKYNLIPKHSFTEQLSSCQVSMLPKNFFSDVQAGRIELRHSPNWNFYEGGVVLDDGTEVKADVVILGTGYDGETKLMSVLPEPYRTVLKNDDGMVPLYRSVVHPRIPDMAILGYPESLSNLGTAEMGARWVAYLLNGRFKLPEIKRMEEETERWTAFMKASTPFYYRNCIALVNIWHTDAVCKDMGWNPKRKKTWLEEFLVPYVNSDYQDSPP